MRLNLKNAGYNGPCYIPEFDLDRLNGQILRVFNVMKDGRWRTLNQIAVQTGDPSPSVSAQLRHLRKEKFGGFNVKKHRIQETGLWLYQLSDEKENLIE